VEFLRIGSVEIGLRSSDLQCKTYGELGRNQDDGMDMKLVTDVIWIGKGRDYVGFTEGW